MFPNAIRRPRISTLVRAGLLPLLAALALQSAAVAQETGTAQTDVLLILDASGSMFSKLSDGRYRITAAKEALTDFISRLPLDGGLNVGLRVYGSSMLAMEPGACEDSLLKVTVDGLQQGLLLKTVQDTQARGATPIAYSLELAADDLGTLSGRKVIVLVTDGEEACGGDVRAAYQSLLDLGIDLDLRIIGFDLADRASASFAGIGTFENATSAAELAAALGRAVLSEVPAPELVAAQVTLLREGAPATDGASLAFVTPQGSYTFQHAGDGIYLADLPAGGYSARIVDVNHGELTFGGLAVVVSQVNEFTFELAPERTVRLTLLDGAPIAGGQAEVAFEGAAERAGGWIGIAPVDLPDEVWLDLSYAEGASGTVVARVPREEGELEARFTVELPEGGWRVIGRSAPFSAIVVGARIEAPAEVPAGSAFGFSWQGPAAVDDYLTIVPAAAPEGVFAAFVYAQDADPATLLAPIVPGDYEVRYVAGDGTTLAAAPVVVIAVGTSVSAPASVVAGERFDVSWSGPGGEGDYVTVVPVGNPEGTWTDFVHLSAGGSSVTLVAPGSPGTYEVRYVSGQGDATLASSEIAVTEASATLSGPDSVSAGEWFSVAWTGPGHEGDYITIVPVGADTGAWLSYAYTSEGQVVSLQAPDEPGEYELRYVLEGVTIEVLAGVPITVR